MENARNQSRKVTEKVEQNNVLEHMQNQRQPDDETKNIIRQVLAEITRNFIDKTKKWT